jgi:hypothetical protein
MRSSVLAAGLVAALTALPAFAQAPQGAPTNIRGKIVKLDGQTLIVKTREGPTVTVVLGPETNLFVTTRKKLSDIHDGDYVASTSMPGKDGKLHAVEVHFLQPTTPETQMPWDLHKDSVMTNAHVTGIAKVKGGTDIALTYKGNATDIVVDRKTAVFGTTKAEMSDLKPGKAIFTVAPKAPDGSLHARFAIVEKNGVKPAL